MKIRLVKYSYKDYKPGDVVDLGDEKNESMVELQRAVWANPPKPPKEKKKIDPEPEPEQEPEVEAVIEPEPEPEAEVKPLIKRRKKKGKMLENELGKQIEANKGKGEGSFWDKLK